MPMTTRRTDPPHLRISAPPVFTQPGDGPLHWLVRDTYHGSARTHAVWTAAVADLTDRLHDASTSPGIDPSQIDGLHRRLGATPEPVTLHWGGEAFTITTTPSVIGRVMDYATRLLNQLGCTVEDVTAHLSAPSTNPIIGHMTVGARRSNPVERYLHWHTGTQWIVTPHDYRCADAWFTRAPLPRAVRDLLLDLANKQR